MKFISWNVNGLRACVQKGFTEYFQEADADFFCLQTKLQEGQIDFAPEDNRLLELCGEERVFQVLQYLQKEPISINYGIGIEEHDQEGRVITLEIC